MESDTATVAQYIKNPTVPSLGNTEEGETSTAKKPTVAKNPRVASATTATNYNTVSLAGDNSSQANESMGVDENSLASWTGPPEVALPSVPLAHRGGGESQTSHIHAIAALKRELARKDEEIAASETVSQRELGRLRAEKHDLEQSVAQLQQTKREQQVELDKLRRLVYNTNHSCACVQNPMLQTLA